MLSGPFQRYSVNTAILKDPTALQRPQGSPQHDSASSANHGTTAPDAAASQTSILPTDVRPCR